MPNCQYINHKHLPPCRKAPIVPYAKMHVFTRHAVIYSTTGAYVLTHSHCALNPYPYPGTRYEIRVPFTQNFLHLK